MLRCDRKTRSEFAHAFRCHAIGLVGDRYRIGTALFEVTRPRVTREVGAGTVCATLASGDVTAVDRQAGAGDVSRFGAGEVRDQGGNLLRRADAAERHQGRYEFDMTSCHIGCNGPARYRSLAMGSGKDGPVVSGETSGAHFLSIFRGKTEKSVPN